MSAGRQLDSTGLKRLHREWRRRTHRRLALVLDGLGTPTNVGSIVRSAAAYGVDRVVTAGPTPPLFSPGVQKTAMGTDRYVTTTHTETTAEALALVRSEGYRPWALELTDTALPVFDLAARVPPEDAVALVVGHEDHGVHKAVLAACDGAVFLPLVGRVGSLNVAASTAAALAELRRQEWRSPDD